MNEEPVRFSVLLQFAQKGAGDGVLLDLTGTLVQFGDLGIPGEALHLVLLHVAVAAQKLDGFVTHLHRGPGGGHLGHAGQFGVDVALIEIPGRLVGEQTGHFDLGGHVGQFVLVHLKLGDLAAELLPGFHIGQGAVKGPLGRAQGLGGDEDAALVEELQHLIESPVLLADQIALGHAHILEGNLGGMHHADAHLGTHVGGGDAGTIGFHQDQAHAAIPRRGLGVGLAQHAVETGQRAAVGDEDFAAVDHPVVAVLGRHRVERGDVRAVIGFGERSTGEHFALGDLGQPGLLLRLAAEVQDDFRGEIGQDQAGAHGAVTGAQGFGHQDVFHDTHALAGVGFREVDADKAEIGGFLPYFFGILVVFFHLGDLAFVEFAFDEIPDGFLDLLLFGGEREFHVASLFI
ncbi:hypothetical protein DESC_610079 [Desulfosarcina cetonica]|nr:hypothetical protein DESC_610079 [Desulfosarcina cetonica]